MKRLKAGRRIKRLKRKVSLESAVKFVRQHQASQQIADVVRALLWLGAPKLFCQLVWIIGAVGLDDTLGKLDVIELFAGKRAICRAAVERGLQALPCEIDDDKIWMDMVGPRGLNRESHGCSGLASHRLAKLQQPIRTTNPVVHRGAAAPECTNIFVVCKACCMFANRALSRTMHPM
jgi:hypothetical protein